MGKVVLKLRSLSWKGESPEQEEEKQEGEKLEETGAGGVDEQTHAK